MNIAVIPCRKGSKGIAGKNFRELAGKPLWRWTVREAVESECFDLIIVSSDGGRFYMDIKACEALGTVYDEHRPKEYATDEAQLEPLLLYYADMYKADTITLLQPTSPLRSSSDISEAFKVFNKGYDSVVSVTSMGDKYWLNTSGGFKPFYNPDKRMNRQDPRTNLIYYENGAIYITKRWILEDNKGRIGGKIGFYEMSQERSYQIDSEFDWKVCETVLGENIWK